MQACLVSLDGASNSQFASSQAKIWVSCTCVAFGVPDSQNGGQTRPLQTVQHGISQQYGVPQFLTHTVWPMHPPETPSLEPEDGLT